MTQNKGFCIVINKEKKGQKFKVKDQWDDILVVEVINPNRNIVRVVKTGKFRGIKCELRELTKFCILPIDHQNFATYITFCRRL